MAEFNGNTPYLTLNGVNVAARFIELSMGQTGEEVDTTHGAATFMQRTGGLSDSTFEIELGYDTSTVSTYINSVCKPNQTYTLDYGPEGNTAGKPRHTQSVFVKSVDGPTLSTKKTYATFKVSCSGADAPTNNMYAGATW